MPDASGKGPKPAESWKLWTGIGALLGIGLSVTWYITLRLTFGPRLSLGDHGAVGDAMAPLTAIFSLGALVAAIVAVHLQRIELAENRDVMKEQAEHAKNAATAQDALAASQAELAAQQKEANRLAWFAEVAQHRASLSGLYDILVKIGLERAALLRNGQMNQEADLRN